MAVIFPNSASLFLRESSSTTPWNSLPNVTVTNTPLTYIQMDTNFYALYSASKGLLDVAQQAAYTGETNKFTGSQEFGGGIDVSGTSTIKGPITFDVGLASLGPLVGTASWATNALSANTATTSTNADTASYALFAETSISSSYALNSTNADTASYFFTASVSSATNADTASYFFTASVSSASIADTASFINDLNQTLTITGSLQVSSSLDTIILFSNLPTTGVGLASGSLYITSSVTGSNGENILCIL